MITNKKRAIQKTSGIKTAPPGHHDTKTDRQRFAREIAKDHKAGAACTCGNH